MITNKIKVRMFVLVDAMGDPVLEAGSAPFDGLNLEDAEEAARSTVRFREGYQLVPITRYLERMLKSMAREMIN